MAQLVLVEDDPDISDMYAFALRRGEHEVIEVCRGDEALPTISNTNPDLVLLDINLPGLGGLEILEAMSGVPSLSQIPVAMLTNQTDAHGQQKAARLGARAYLVKAETTPRQLCEAVQRLIDPGLPAAAGGEA